MFKYGSLYGMIYSVLGDQQVDGLGYQFAAASTDGITWTFASSVVLRPSVGWESVQVYAAALLKENTAPFAAPITDPNGRWHLYYSGYDGTHGQSGLAYLTPN